MAKRKKKKTKGFLEDTTHDMNKMFAALSIKNMDDFSNRNILDKILPDETLSDDEMNRKMYEDALFAIKSGMKVQYPKNDHGTIAYFAAFFIIKSKEYPTL